jgi:hypothetical protein
MSRIDEALKRAVEGTGTAQPQGAEHRANTQADGGLHVRPVPVRAGARDPYVLIDR